MIPNIETLKQFQLQLEIAQEITISFNITLEAVVNN